ncbi:MAG: hypothetical protein M1823_001173 [Watsoniomyces obsoletus]|nr:MAG: hypothetical protein M1823_001173 [Watsoniomyces obsoletus]
MLGPDPNLPNPRSQQQQENNIPKRPSFVNTRSRASSSSSLSLKPPRTPRFAEATAVHSPIEPSQTGRSPFADPPGTMTTHYPPQPQPSDVGFGYISETNQSRTASYVPVEEECRASLAPKSPLKSALRVPGTPGRQLENPLSPTFREEQILEKREVETEKENAKDLKVKIRVRLAKIVLRGVNFSCSLIVLSMLAATFAIFNATKRLAPRNNLPPWARNSIIWPQITLLVIASISLLFSIFVIFAYMRKGHRRAEKVAVYYNIVAVTFFAASIIMWAVGAGILNHSKETSNGNDVWGWACKDNRRKFLFQDDVNYSLVCRLQNWSLVCCIIEVVVEVLVIAIYAFVFFRYWSKRKLRKTMDLRDKARSDLYLAQLRSQSAPNTPGFGGPMSPMSPRFGGPRTGGEDSYSQAEKGESPTTQFATASPSSQAKPFKLQPPPIKVHQASPKMSGDGFDRQNNTEIPPPLHSPGAPGEQQYASVPIPGAYASPMASPSFAPQSAVGPLPGQAVTSEERVETGPPHQ